MFETIEIPVWIVWVAGVLALAGLLDRILGPVVSWYLRRRLNRAITRLNERLELKIPPFKLTRRRVMIDRLAHDPKVIEAVLEHMEQEKVPYRVAERRAYLYAREIVPGFSAFAYFAFGTRLARWLSKTLYRVRLGFADESSLNGIDKNATVVFVMNHRSNMDYVLVTYLAARRSALAYAVGEWAAVWPLKQLIRSLGGYFIRRKSRNQLYRKVLARYVQMATEGGVAQAVFPEGGLTRDGLLKPAKLGLLSYIVAGFDETGDRDVVFVPVGLNYDRVLEDRVLLATGTAEQAGLVLKMVTFIRFVFRHFFLRIAGKFRRFGYASVHFAEPVSLKTFLVEHPDRKREAVTRDLGRDLIERLGYAIPVLPVALISRILVDWKAETISRADLKERASGLLQTLIKDGAYTHIPKGNHSQAIDIGINQLKLRRVLKDSGDGFAINQSEMQLLGYYANSIAHLGG
ncbi:MAG: glycerol-3-phosphate acyltransferase [Rhodobacteraceae bacterium]|nr:glycerol-3-phosphate acyltransferase [Paracoccaceae bacterium]